MGAQLLRFAAREDAVLDTARIGALRQSLGEERCREVVAEVVFHLTDRLAQLEIALRDGHGQEAQLLASRLAGLSEQLGLSNFARVSRDLRRCLCAGDEVATSAVGSRLLRLGADSMFSVILYAEYSTL